MINDLDYEGIKFPVSKRYYCRTEKKNNIFINVFCYENDLTYPVYISHQKFKNCMDLLLISNGKSHTVCISKTLTDLCVIKQKIKIKKYFMQVLFTIF